MSCAICIISFIFKLSTYDQIFATDEDLDILRHNKNAAPYLLTGYKVCATLGRGGGQVVSVLAFYSNDTSSNERRGLAHFLMILHTCACSHQQRSKREKIYF